MKTLYKNILLFIKIKITLSVVLTTILGFILANGTFDLNFLALIFGVFFLSSGSSALNQTQEWQADALMKRTENRPIPKKFFSQEFGFIFSFVFIILGVAFLFFFNNEHLPSVLGILAVVFYNLIYTPLKLRSAFAAVPGAIIGAIPPMIGWTFAGGEIFNPQILALALFFFLWQVPHFWLLLLVYEDDYRRAGFPVLTDKVNKIQIARISYVWIIAMVLCAFAVPFLGNSSNYFSPAILFFIGLFFLFRFSKVLQIVQPTSFYKKVFIQLNAFVLLIMIIFSLNRFINF